MNQAQNFLKGILKENPVLILILGTCPTLAVTSSAQNGLGMGLAATFVLLCSNAVIAAIKDLVPDKVRIPIYIVVIAAFVTIVDLVMAAYTPALHKTLGIFIPLIVVNCIILGRAEAFAARNDVLSSVVDGAGMGVGFTLALTVLGAIREALGSGAVFGQKFLAGDGILLFVLPPGAFICFAFMIAAVNALNRAMAAKGKR
ncbi:MAG: electron transport complex subunit E [Elusimicrobia bacterium]|nr:electron transport complex subunit E [Elusimicrobiota bacterium]